MYILVIRLFYITSRFYFYFGGVLLSIGYIYIYIYIYINIYIYHIGSYIMLSLITTWL